MKITIKTMMLFTHNVKRIKYAAHKNGHVDDTCKRGQSETKNPFIYAGSPIRVRLLAVPSYNMQFSKSRVLVFTRCSKIPSCRHRVFCGYTAWDLPWPLCEMCTDWLPHPPFLLSTEMSKPFSLEHCFHDEKVRYFFQQTLLAFGYLKLLFLMLPETAI